MDIPTRPARMAVAVAALVVTAGCAAGGDEAERTTDVPTYSPSPSPSTSPPAESPAETSDDQLEAKPDFDPPPVQQDGVRGEILQAFWDYYEVQVRTQHRMDPVMPEYAAVMTGDELVAHSKEIRTYNQEGRRLYGAPVISDVQVLDLQLRMSPPQAVVGACVDDTNWVGSKDVPEPDPPGTNLHYTRVGVAQEKGAWKVYGHAIEKRDQGRCAD